MVKWAFICRKKKNGGLGVKNLKAMNNALLTKWLWRFDVESEALWRRIVEEKYGVSDVEWLSKQPTGAYGFSVWKGVMKRKDFFLQNFQFKVNNGVKTRFWGDRWILDDALSNIFPHLYAAARSKFSTVAHVCSGSLTDLFQKLCLLRRLSVQASNEFGIMQDSLSNFSLNPEVEDMLRWALKEKKSYSVKSSYHKLAPSDVIPNQDTFIFIWEQGYPPKIGFFI